MGYITIYHGGSHVIEKPTFGFGNIHNDYGLGFYCTPFEDLAGEWACKNHSNGFVNEYRLDTTGLKILDLSDSTRIREFVALLSVSRQFCLHHKRSLDFMNELVQEYLPNYQEYDVIIGPRGDCSTYLLVVEYLNQRLSLSHLALAVYSDKERMQIVPRTASAFRALSYVGSSPVSREICIPVKKGRDRKLYRFIFDEDTVRANTILATIGEFFDYGINALHMDGEQLFARLIATGLAEEFERDNPVYAGGMSGIELIDELLYRTNDKRNYLEPRLCNNKSRAYFAGSLLAYYQLYSTERFQDLLRQGLTYEKLQEISDKTEHNLKKSLELVEKFLEKKKNPQITNLKRLRKLCGLTQRELSELSGVTLRMVQLYEQRQNDITHASILVLLSLAHTLGCEPQDLLE